MAPPAGFRHPRYRLQRLLGEGGMGRVYLARDLLDDALVALKLYPSRYYDERLRGEFLILRELHHPGIARALHFGVSEADGAPFFTLQYIVGEPLDLFLRSRPQALAVALLRKTAAALAYLHRRGVLHLDVKPGNILVADPGRRSAPEPILIDFGLFRKVHGPRAPLGHGTLPYAPPELFENESPSPASDVYSFAATFYRIFSGRSPVSGASFEDYARAHREGRPAPLPEAPAALEPILLRALAKDPAKRFADAGELLVAVRSVAAGPAGAAGAAGATGAAAPAGSDAPSPVFHEPDFVGRAREIETARRWLAGDRRRVPVLEVCGGGGWGKSRFLERLETIVETHSKKTLVLRAAAGAGLDLFSEVLRRAALLNPSPPAPERARRRQALADVERARRRGAPDAPLARPEEDRWLARSVAAALLPLLRADTVLLVDDLHLAGAPGALLVDELARGRAAGRDAAGGGVVAAHAEDSEAAAAPLPWREAGLSLRLALGPFSQREALAIDLEGVDGALAAFSPARVRELKSALHREVGGHPLFFVRGLLDLAGDPEPAARLAPPERVLAGFRRLAGEERELALALAALGRPAAEEELAGICGCARNDIAARFERLRRAGFAARRGERLTMVHPAVADAVLGSLAAGDRSVLHARLGRALEGRGPGRARAAAGRADGALEAAWHALRAGDDEKALLLARRWLDRPKPPAKAAGEKALAVLRNAAGRAGRDTQAGRGLREALADALEGLGRFEESAAALRPLLHGKGAGRGEARLHRKLGALALRSGKTRLALSHLSRSLESRSRADRVEVIHAHAELALLHHFRGETDLALRHADRGVALWEACRGGERRAALTSALRLHGILGQVHIRRLEFEKAAARLRSGLTLARSLGSRPNIALLLNNLALAHHLSGRFRVALDTFRRAEVAAGELGDPAALATIRSNVVQILAKLGRFGAARDLLDEIERAPAIRQGGRLRLHALYSRGLLLNLLGSDADDVWSAVESLCGEVGDAFLAGFARVYRAEGMIAAGRLSAARRLLSPPEDPGGAGPLTRVLESMNDSRRALVEALAGRPERSRKLRRTGAAREEGAPSLLEAWNRHYRGRAAMECGDLEEAQRDLLAARRVLGAAGFAAGRIECALALADLHLRAGPGDARRRRQARREIAEALRTPLESPAATAPRALGSRAAILEARVLLADMTGGGGNGAGSHRPPAREAALLDLLARAAGDPALAAMPDCRLELEVAAAAARLLGGRAAAPAGRTRLDHLRAELALRLDAADRPAFRKRDPWRRFALEPLRPPPRGIRLKAVHAEELRRLLAALARPGGEPPAAAGSLALDAAAAQLGRALRARRVSILGGAGTCLLAAWPQLAAGTSRRSPGATTLGAAAGSAALRVERSGTRPFSAAEAVFLEAAAQALAPHVERAEASRTRTPGETAPAPASDGAGTETASLTRTRTLHARRQSSTTRARLAREEGIVVGGREFARIVDLAREVAAAEIPVLITGESGTGKDIVARLIHRFSPRAAGPYVSENASALHPDLFAADLFGYEQGAFTGAEESRTGFLFRAAGGTFHLEEVGDLDAALQQRLLRVIEEKAVRPLGATSARRLDVRFVASSHRDLEGMVRRGEFRADLFYRFAGARIDVPPLRQRLDEIPALVAHAWRGFAPEARFPRRALEALAAHSWPGNIRELITVLRRLSLEAGGSPSADDVRAAIGSPPPGGLFSPAVFEAHRFEDLQRSLEESYLQHLLAKHEGSLERIARALGTSTRSIYRRFERLGLKPKQLTGRQA